LRQYERQRERMLGNRSWIPEVPKLRHDQKQNIVLVLTKLVCKCEKEGSVDRRTEAIPPARALEYNRVPRLGYRTGALEHHS